MPSRPAEAESARRRGLLMEQEKSGLTQTEFCQRRGVSLHAFRSWKYRPAPLKPRAVSPSKPHLVPVRLLAGTDVALELGIRGGRTIRVRPGFDEVTLQRLVLALESSLC